MRRLVPFPFVGQHSFRFADKLTIRLSNFEHLVVVEWCRPGYCLKAVNFPVLRFSNLEALFLLDLWTGEL